MTALYILRTNLLLLLLVLFTQSAQSSDSKTIVFPSGDGIPITADLYMPHPREAPLIVLFHQAGWSRGEYREIAPQLNKLGYNCLAVDLRSGENVNRTDNETYKKAREAGKATNYLDAYDDMKAAVSYAKLNYAGGRLVVFGSSYSAALVLLLAAEQPGAVSGVVAFSPGEYFTRAGKSATFIQEAAAKVKAPVFIASARKEQEQWKAIYNALPADSRTFFVPATEGNHGARALWSQFDDNQAYWSELKAFLSAYFPTAANPKK